MKPTAIILSKILVFKLILFLRPMHLPVTNKRGGASLHAAIVGGNLTTTDSFVASTVIYSLYEGLVVLLHGHGAYSFATIGNFGLFDDVIQRVDLTAISILF